MNSILLLFNEDTNDMSLSFLSGSLPGQTSFARASAGGFNNGVGTMTTAASGVPRFDCDPITHALLGILIENQCTNLWYPSIPNLAATSIVTGDSAVLAPDGTLTTKYFGDDSSSGQHYAVQWLSTSFTVGSPYTLSIYSKAKEQSVIQLVHPSASFGTSAYANFDLINGRVGIVGSAASAAIREVGGGWYRCSVTSTAAVSNSVAVGALALTNNNAGAGRYPSYVGTGTGIYIWGAQTEAGTSATSYIPTISSVVTRASDRLSFTIPIGVNKLRYIFDDNSSQDITVSPGAYTVPTNLSRPRIKRIIGIS